MEWGDRVMKKITFIALGLSGLNTTQAWSGCAIVWSGDSTGSLLIVSTRQSLLLT
jgi:hypothetical protein